MKMSRSRLAFCCIMISLPSVCFAESIARILIRDGWKCVEQEDFHKAGELLEEAIVEAKAGTERGDIAESNAKLAWVKHQVHDKVSAARLAAIASEMPLSGDDRIRVEIVLADTAGTRLLAIEHYTKARSLLANLDNSLLHGRTALKLASLQLKLAKFDDAFNSSQDAIRLLSQPLDATLVAQAQIIAAQAAFATKDVKKCERALAAVGELIRVNGELNLSPHVRAEFFVTTADIQFYRGEFSAALRSLSLARSALSAVVPNNDKLLVPILLRAADVLVSMGWLRKASELVEWTMHFDEQLDHCLASKAFATRGKVHLAAGRYRDAERDFLVAFDRSRRFQGAPASCISLQLRTTELLLGKQGGVAATVRQVMAESLSDLQSAVALRLLAKEKLMSGRSSTAVALSTRSLEVLDQLSAGRTVESLESLVVLCEAEIASSDLIKASETLDRFQSSLDSMRQSSDLWVAKRLELSGRLHLAKKEDREAGADFQRCFEIWCLPNPHGKANEVRDEFTSPEKAKLHLGLATIAKAAEDEAGAAEHWASAYAAMTTQLDDGAIAMRVMGTAEFCGQHGRLVEAVWFYERARELVRAAPDGHQQILKIEFKLEELVRMNELSKR